MVAELSELELKCIEPMTRVQVLAAIRQREDCLPPDLRERLDEQPVGRLHLLLLAARLIYALRQLPGADWMKETPQ